MNIGKIKLYPLAILGWVAVFYMAFTGIHDIRLWIVLVFLFTERMLAQLVLWLSVQAFKALVQNTVKMLREAGIPPNAG